MRDPVDIKVFPNSLIDDMRRTFGVVCARLGLVPQCDKATAVVVAKIVELANAGFCGEDLMAEALRFFEASEIQRSGQVPPDRGSASACQRLGG